MTESEEEREEWVLLARLILHPLRDGLHSIRAGQEMDDDAQIRMGKVQSHEFPETVASVLAAKDDWTQRALVPSRGSSGSSISQVPTLRTPALKGPVKAVSPVCSTQRLRGFSPVRFFDTWLTVMIFVIEHQTDLGINNQPVLSPSCLPVGTLEFFQLVLETFWNFKAFCIA